MVRTKPPARNTFLAFTAPKSCNLSLPSSFYFALEKAGSGAFGTLDETWGVGPDWTGQNK
jgi:hypothetical protein